MNLARLGFSVLLLFATCVSLQGQAGTTRSNSLPTPSHEARIPALTVPAFVRWDKNQLLTWSFDGTVYVSPSKPGVVGYDRDGKIAQEAIIWFGDAVRVGLTDAAVNPVGRLLVAGGMSKADGKGANFIAEIDENGHVGRSLRTEPFIPRQICAASDDSIWSFGANKGIASGMMLRLFTLDKGQLEAVLDRSELNSDVAFGSYPGEIQLLCNSQKVGVLNFRSQQWVEFNQVTRTLTTTNIKPLSAWKSTMSGSAMTASGEILISVSSLDSRRALTRTTIYKLAFDAAGGASWQPIVSASAKTQVIYRILGVDGTEVVYTRGRDGKALWSKID